MTAGGDAPRLWGDVRSGRWLYDDGEELSTAMSRAREEVVVSSERETKLTK